MLRLLLLCLFVAIFCIGCDNTASRQQQAEDARRAATAAKLKQAGEKMQNSTRSDLPAEDPAGDSP